MVILDEYCTLEGAAARRDCSRTTIWRRIKAGELITHRLLGRLLVKIEEVDRLEIPRRRRAVGSSDGASGGA